MWQAMLRFSPRLSTFSCVLALMLIADGCAPSSAHRLSLIASFTGDSFGRCTAKPHCARYIPCATPSV